MRSIAIQQAIDAKLHLLDHDFKNNWISKQKDVVCNWCKLSAAAVLLCLHHADGYLQGARHLLRCLFIILSILGPTKWPSIDLTPLFAFEQSLLCLRGAAKSR